VPRLDPLVADGLLALVAAGVAVAQLEGAASPRDRGALNVALVLLQTLALVGRRRFPFVVFAAGVVALGIQGLLDLWSPTVAFLAVNVALYSLAAYGDRRLAVLGVGGWLALLTLRLVQLVVTAWPQVAVADVFDVVDDYVLLAAAWTLGVGIRQRRLHAAALEDRAARLEREREEKARQAATQERLRIARELHDVVAHSLSVIGVQAGAARLVLDTGPDPARAREAVAAIEATANRAMAEMRRALGILRDPQSTGGLGLSPPDPRSTGGLGLSPPDPRSTGGLGLSPPDPRGADASLAPLPGLAQLPDLLDQVRRAGLPVELAVHGTPRPLAASVDLSLYRIVQEALTNALKHAGAAHAKVLVRYDRHDVEVEVTDDGRGPAPPADGPAGRDGAGTVGMRERVALFGGELRVGPRPHGGYAVRACLPISAEEP
jgi:signal transduction histidine kinase